MANSEQNAEHIDMSCHGIMFMLVDRREAWVRAWAVYLRRTCSNTWVCGGMAGMGSISGLGGNPPDCDANNRVNECRRKEIPETIQVGIQVGTTVRLGSLKRWDKRITGQQANRPRGRLIGGGCGG